MPAIMCSCGYSREEWNGLLRCSHCDSGICDNPDTCARCRTYNLTVGKRASA